MRTVLLVVLLIALPVATEAVAQGGWLLRLIQSGQTQHYALAMAAGIVVMVTMLLLF